MLHKCMLGGIFVWHKAVILSFTSSCSQVMKFHGEVSMRNLRYDLLRFAFVHGNKNIFFGKA